MRILVVLSYYAPHWTGLTQYARRAAESWAALGHTVTVVTTRHDPALAATETIGGVAVVRCGVVARVSRAAVAPALLPAVWAALADCDVAVVHTPLPEAGAVGQLCRWRRIPYLCIHHGDVVLPAGLRNARYSAAMRCSAQSAYATAAAVVTHSADYADHSTWLAPLRWRVTVVPPPVDLTPVGTRAAARAALGLPAEAYVVGFFGRRVVEKGFDRLTTIVPALRQRHPNLHILHVGPPAVAYEPTQPLLPEIHGYGLVTDAETLARLYQACDVVVVPSRSDCYPSVAVEALRCGTPIVVHDTPGLRSIVWQAGVGRVVDCADPGALLAALAERPTPVDPAAMAARFDAHHSAAASSALLERVVAAAQPPAAVVQRHLANEVDMAYRRRAAWLVTAMDVGSARSILDCGCGQGAYVQLLRQLTDGMVVGVDRDRFRLGQAAGQPVVEADIAALPFAPQRFDRILLSEVLEHLDDDVATLQVLRTLLTPTGLLAVSVPHARYPVLWDPIEHVRRLLKMPPLRQHPWVATIWSNHVRLYTPVQLRAVLERAGYEVIAVEQQTRATVPFAHFIVYSIGKPLLDNNWLPVRWRAYADRRMGTANDGQWWHPFNQLRGVFHCIDRTNDGIIDQRGPAVTIVALARPRQADAPL